MGGGVSVEVKISEPVPEAENWKVTFTFWFCWLHVGTEKRKIEFYLIKTSLSLVFFCVHYTD